MFSKVGVSRPSSNGESMPGIATEQYVDAAPQAVWALITDLDNWQSSISGIKKLERLDAGTAFAVGTRWRETRLMFKKEATEEMEVTALDPGKSYTVEAHHGDTHYTSVLTVSERGAGTALTMTFDTATNGLLATVLSKTIGKAVEGYTRKALVRDLSDIAAAAEAAKGS